MTEVEISSIPPLDPNEQSLLDMHTVLNVFNVLRGELVLIGINAADDEDWLADALAVCDRLIAALRDPVKALDAARNVEQSIGAILGCIDRKLSDRSERRTDPEVLGSLDNLASVFSILRMRAKEVLARAEAREPWIDFSVTELHADFMAVFAAIEKNSHGRYRLLFNAALKEPPDYYIDFAIESVDGDKLRMPAVFKDVMRDLIANARKYTAPGGRITAALYAGKDAVRFCVEDSGRGIPPAELTEVIKFGRRGSNVGDVRTMGGGFGLTKAFLVTKQFGGRFWIASQLGVGTRIRIVLPTSTANRVAGAADVACARS